MGVVDQGRQLSALLLRHGISQDDIHLFPDDARGGIHDVYKGFVFAVKIAHKMLGTLGQLEQGLRADDLTGRSRLGGVVPGQKCQIFEIIANFIGFGTHRSS